MNVKLEKLSQCKVKLEITCTKEEFNNALDRAIDEACKKVEVPGFRKGHVTRRVFLSRFGEAAAYEDAINNVMNDTYPQALEETKVIAVGYPKVDCNFETLGRDKEFVYTAEVEIWPDITLGEYKGVEVEKEQVNVTEAEVENYINQVLKNKSELVLVEDRTLQLNDTAVFDFEGFVDGVAFEGGKAENYSLKIGSGQFIPGFEDGMVGLATGEERDVVVTFPENYGASDLAGKEATFKVKLQDIKEEVLPELTDEFVSELEVEGVKTVEEYKTNILNKLTEEKTQASDNKFVADLLDKVCEDAIADIPEAMIETEVENQVRRIEEQAKMYGMPLEMLLQYSGMKDLDAFKAQAREYSAKKVLEEVVLDKVARVENLVPTEEAIEAEYATLAEGYHQDVELVKKQISKENIIAFLTNKLAIDFLKANAIVK